MRQVFVNFVLHCIDERLRSLKFIVFYEELEYFLKIFSSVLLQTCK
jgi:hypothetical protein